MKTSLALFSFSLIAFTAAVAPELSSRIINGGEAGRTQFKYQVGLRFYGETGGTWCGGTIISDRWIVTAAYCTEEMVGVDVYLGAWNTENRNEEGQQVIYAGKRYIIPHENFTNTKNDIALIKLPAPIRFNDYIQPAKLPKYRPAGNYSTYHGVSAFTSGWGLTESSDRPGILRYIEKPIMDFNTCNKAYFNILNEETQICQDSTLNQYACSGDQGGPLVVREWDDRLLIGIVSKGIGADCMSGFPGVFTRITGFLEWIQKHTGLVENDE